MWAALSDERACLQISVAAGLASAVFFGSESRGTHDHISLSQFLDSHNLEGVVPLFISTRNRTAQLIPQAFC
jgi:hypothetical protein